MLAASLRGLWEHKFRTLLLALAVVGGVSFVSASFIFTDTIASAFDDAFTEAAAGLDATVTIDPESIADDFAFGEQRIDGSLAETIAGVSGVEEVFINLTGFVQIVAEDSEEIPAGFGAPDFLAAWNEAPGFYELAEGTPPSEPGTVVIAASLAESGGYSLGDTLTISVLGPTEDLQIVGVAEIEGGNVFGGANFVFVGLSEARRLLDLPDEADTFDVTFVADADPEATLDAIQAQLPDGIRALDAQSFAEEQAAEVRDGLGFITTFLLVFAAVSVVVGVFVVYNAFRTVIGQRTRELALFRLLGATRRQVLTSVIFEAIVIALLATAVGIPAGFGLAALLRTILELVGSDLPQGAVGLDLRTALVATAVGLVTTVLSAIIPAVRASRVLPIAALADVDERPSHPAVAWSWSLSLLAVGAGVALWALIARQALWIVGAGALVMMAGFYILGAATAPGIMRLAERVVGKSTVTRTLATQNARRSPRRTGSTAGALMIGVALVTAVSIVVFTTQTTARDSIEQAFPADAVIFPGFGPVQALAPGVDDAVVALAEVEGAAAVKSGPARIAGETTFLVGVNPAQIGLVAIFEDVEGTFDDLEGATVAVQRSEADRTGLELGDSVEVFVTGDEIDHEVVAIFDFAGEASDQASYYVNTDQYAVLDPTLPEVQISVLFAEGVTDEEGKAAVEGVLDEFGGATIFTQEDLLGQIEQALLGVLFLIFGLLGMSIVIALVGVVLVLVLSVFERRREIGLVRAVGMIRPQVRGMIRWEALLVALLGAILGLVAGLALGWIGSWAVFGRGFSYDVPWVTVIAALVGSGIAGVVAAIYPAYRASNLNILEAIAYE